MRYIYKRNFLNELAELCRFLLYLDWSRFKFHLHQLPSDKSSSNSRSNFVIICECFSKLPYEDFLVNFLHILFRYLWILAILWNIIVMDVIKLIIREWVLKSLLQIPRPPEERKKNQREFSFVGCLFFRFPYHHLNLHKLLHVLLESWESSWVNEEGKFSFCVLSERKPNKKSFQFRLCEKQKVDFPSEILSKTREAQFKFL